MADLAVNCSGALRRTWRRLWIAGCWNAVVNSHQQHLICTGMIIMYTMHLEQATLKMVFRVTCTNCFKTAITFYFH